AFEALGNLHQLLNRGVRLNLLPQLGNLFERLSETDVSPANGRRDHLGDAVDFGVGHFQGAAHVLDRGPGSKRSEGDDLADGLAPIEIGDVVDDVAAPADAKIDIDVGHGNATRVEETLEDEVIL